MPPALAPGSSENRLPEASSRDTNVAAWVTGGVDVASAGAPLNGIERRGRDGPGEGAHGTLRGVSIVHRPGEVMTIIPARGARLAALFTAALVAASLSCASAEDLIASDDLGDARSELRRTFVSAEGEVERIASEAERQLDRTYPGGEILFARVRALRGERVVHASSRTHELLRDTRFDPMEIHRGALEAQLDRDLQFFTETRGVDLDDEDLSPLDRVLHVHQATNVEFEGELARLAREDLPRSVAGSRARTAGSSRPLSPECTPASSMCSMIAGDDRRVSPSHTASTSTSTAVGEEMIDQHRDGPATPSRPRACSCSSALDVL